MSQKIVYLFHLDFNVILLFIGGNSVNMYSNQLRFIETKLTSFMFGSSLMLPQVFYANV